MTRVAIAALLVSRAIGPARSRASNTMASTASAAKNHVANAFRTFETGGGVNTTIRKDAPYDLVFANILFRPLVGLSGEIERLTAPGGHVILSGLLNHQEPLVRHAYTGRGLSLVHRVRKDGWSSLVFRKA